MQELSNREISRFRSRVLELRGWKLSSVYRVDHLLQLCRRHVFRHEWRVDLHQMYNWDVRSSRRSDKVRSLYRGHLPAFSRLRHLRKLPDGCVPAIYRRKQLLVMPHRDVPERRRFCQLHGVPRRHVSGECGRCSWLCELPCGNLRWFHWKQRMQQLCSWSVLSQASPCEESAR